MIRKIGIGLMILTLLFIPVGFADNGTNEREPFKGFKDVEASHYAYEAIMTMKELGIINGYDDGRFKPDGDVSRAEFAKMMVMALRIDLPKVTKSSFEDLNGNSWATRYVEAAKPYLTGYVTNSKYYFKPDAPAVREDMAVALVKALDKPIVSSTILDKYADRSTISEALKPYVATAIGNGLMQGSTNDSKWYFKPMGKLTRAEAAQLLMNVIQEEKIVFDDPVEEKVVFEDEFDASNLTIVEKDGGLYLEWAPISHSKFKGYKVVASTSDTTPKYPENGYYKYITNASTNSILIKAGNSYNGGDVGTFKSDETYYFSITVLYDGETVTGNVVTVVMP